MTSSRYHNGIHDIVKPSDLRYHGQTAIGGLRDFEAQKKQGKNPVFKASSIGLDEEDFDCWK